MQTIFLRIIKKTWLESTIITQIYFVPQNIFSKKHTNSLENLIKN